MYEFYIFVLTISKYRTMFCNDAFLRMQIIILKHYHYLMLQYINLV